jgi:hypothetical protein
MKFYDIYLPFIGSSRWLNPADPSSDPSEIIFDKSKNVLSSEFEFVILEFRDAHGSVIKFVEPEFETKRVDLVHDKPVNPVGFGLTGLTD